MKEKTTDRLIQIILLCIIAAGFTGTALILINSNSGGAPGGGWGGAGRGAGGDDAAVAVEAAEVTRRTVSKHIRVNGDVVSDVSVDIFPDTSGKLVQLKVRPGSSVTKGDIIGVVDPSTPGLVYSKSNIISTISGTVTELNADVGDTVRTTSPIAVIGDLSNLSIVTYIPERFITYLKTGLVAQIQLEAFPDLSFSARVVQLSPVVDTVSRSLEIKLQLEQPDPRIRAGMFASIRLITQESKNTLAVPATSVMRFYDESSVFVLEENNRVAKREVEEGLVTDELVEITRGLSEGEIVISRGTSSLTDGALVRVISAQPAEED